MGRLPESIDDIYDNPHDFGAPTLEEFAKNREKWMGRDDDALISVTEGGQGIKKDYRRHQYEIEGYRCRTLEEVERIARSQGIPLRELDYRATLIDTGSGKNDVLVKFISKKERETRAKWS